MVVQLAKYAFKAKKVIAIAGSAEKCEWLRTIGADVALYVFIALYHHRPQSMMIGQKLQGKLL